MVYLNSNFLYGDDFEPKKGTLVIEDEIIKGFTSEHHSNVLNYKGLVIPPLINSHTHIGDNSIKDIGIGKSLDELVKPPNGLKHKFLNTCSEKELVQGMSEGLYDLENNGIKAFCDFRENGLNGINSLKSAFEDSNVSIKPIILGRPTQIEENLLKDEISIILDNCDGLGLSGSNEYSDQELKFICKLVNKKMLSIHANEHKGSVQYSKEKYGISEIERLINLNIKPDFLIHATHSSSDDLSLLNENNIPVVVCPRANASFNVGLPDIPKMLEYNLKLGIGTDNFMANSPSIFKEMDFIYKIYHVDPKEILKMATVNGAEILGLQNTGVIKEGYIPTFTFIKNGNILKTSKNIAASVVTRLENGDVDSKFLVC
ncbi:cytosine/adenosine deaminase-related metal-dependent hydrolase [Methanococcus maripaludis]|uniref:Cytosine/adenosine deaminase-related metal-dependent hydrolase n=1 Tax=Methanococcus maripaludis TaxID=39152 RepID=A0A7J9NQE9_METMI|nr:amidohydrolase family protein [Methanococcus maripaludis]MBA2847279.1 cytosine/adenosine deaminase-related metal-dependent hydrolase [Methanococcus maripaludis]